MKPKAQRIAIAEVMGYRRLPGRRELWRHPLDGFDCTANGLPNYLNDLNAIHRAAHRELSYDEKQKYKRVLNRVCGPATHPIFASASECSEAFLRTLGLWVSATRQDGGQRT